MLLCPRVQFKSVECHALGANRILGEIAADFGVEAIAVHAEVSRRVAEADEAVRDVQIVAERCHTGREREAAGEDLGAAIAKYLKDLAAGTSTRRDEKPSRACESYVRREGHAGGNDLEAVSRR
jgi:hypothetical protein